MHVCRLSVNLDLNSFPQKSHGRDIPPRWWASMWSMMAWARPSFLHTLQILVLLPFGRMFELGSIIDLTLSSSCCKSPDKKFETFVSLCVFAKDLSPWKLHESVCRCAFSNLLNGFEFVCCAGEFAGSFSVLFSTFSVGPVNPLSLSSSAMPRKESRLSWKTFASPS